MGRVFVQAALMAAAGLALTGCGFGDVRAPLPEFMRAKAPETPPPETPPDVKRILAEKLDAVFTAASQPRQVQVSAPQHDLRGPGWTACVKAELTSVTGKPLGMQIYRITIVDGAVSDRRHIETDDNCVTASYEPIQVMRAIN